MQPQLTQSTPLFENDRFNLLGLRATDHINTMLSYWDREGICRFANQPYLTRFGLERELLVNVMDKRTMLGDNIYEKTLPYIEAVLEGKQQVFERKELNPDNTEHYSITSYFPDVQQHEVVGYFVQITDITPVKEMEVKIRNLEKAKERELLRSVIETQELEREVIAFQLKESVNQTLAYCKLMLEKSRETQKGSAFLKNFSTYIHQAIDELNALSTQMSPSIIKLLGFEAGVKEYMQVFEEKRKVDIEFQCSGDIESMASNDKIALFRIIQNYLLSFIDNSKGSHISIGVEYFHPTVKMTLIHDDTEFQLDITSKQYTDLLNRVEYYHGCVADSVQFGLAVLQIELLDVA